MSENEKLLGIARVHWIHLAKGAVWIFAPLMVWGVLMDLLGRYVYPAVPAPMADAVHIILYYLFAAFLLMGIIIFILSALHFMVTEMALTTKRVIYKTGWMFVQVKEVDLEEIKAADVDNGWLGRFLNYGYLILDSRFVGTLNLASIAYPYAYLRLLNKARGDLKQDSVNVILEGHESVGQREADEKARSIQHEVNDALSEISYKPRYSTFTEGPAAPSFEEYNYDGDGSSSPPRERPVFVPRKGWHDKILRSFATANLWR